MNSLAIFALFIAAAVAKPTGYQQVSVSQDTLGNYNLKYDIDGISRVEQRDVHGNVAGGYSYVDPHGVLRTIEFTAGPHGFNAVGADIPQPVQDTPEVAIAKAEHLSVLRTEQLSAPVVLPAEHGVLAPQILEIPAVPVLKSLESVPLAVPDVIPHSKFLIH